MTDRIRTTAGKKAGIPKLHIEDLNTRLIVQALIERLEVLDGVVGNELDRAVTWRCLQDGDSACPSSFQKISPTLLEE